MTKRMLIDATHAEETRIVVLDGNRLEDFDVETSTKRQLKGNIYLAKVVRVEPSLQAAFVEYGNGRHGFLAFGEIHPDYYQIPVADRQRLIEMQAEEARLEEEEADLELALEQAAYAEPALIEVTAEPIAVAIPAAEEPVPAWAVAHEPPLFARAEIEDAVPEAVEPVAPDAWAVASVPPLLALWQDPEPAADVEEPAEEAASEAVEEPVEAWARAALPLLIAPERVIEAEAETEEHGSDEDDDEDPDDVAEDVAPPETMGGDGDGGDDRAERRQQSRFLRNYKIQEVIRRRQILLIQVVKEERGTKGAALTTYLSLAGRFSVLMPNSPRGGGISRKITSAADRRRLKEIMTELDIPRGMGMIVRTAGAQRPKPEIKRDCEYLLRLWDDIREHTMKSVAPALIYEEASLIKRAIRDVYSRDVDEILVDGEEGWRAAHDFMRMLMPSHAKKVQLWKDPTGQPLFARSQVEAQLDAMLMPIVQLRSGGYLVINQAEALVAIDVNSGRSTRERNIEETALRTNLEAADEVARQLRLRDLAGLIVIDFIDMESKRHNAMVERRMKDALKNDRARIQVGQISHFGLLEMSRQRLRPSLAETSFIPCPHCGGTGHVRSTENAAIHVLRGIEDEGAKRRAAEIVVHLATPIALYLLNHKRDRLREIEARYAMRVIIAADDSQVTPLYRIERARPQTAIDPHGAITPDAPAPLPPPRMAPPIEAEPEEDDDVVLSDEQESEDDAEDRAAEAARPAGQPETAEEADRRRKRRRRRRRGRREDEPGGQDSREESGAMADGAAETSDDADGEPTADAAPVEPGADESVEAAPDADLVAQLVPPADGTPEASDSDEEARNRRRGRRGGRRRKRDDSEVPAVAQIGAEQPELPPVYSGPTPANPFGGEVFDIFDVMEQAEQNAEAARLAAREAEPVVVAEVAPEVEIVSEPVVEDPATVDATSVEAPMPEAAVSAPPEIAVEATPEIAPAVVETEIQAEPPVEIVAPMAAEPVAVEAAPVVEPPAAMPEPEPTAPEPEAKAEPISGPAIQPIIIGDGATPSAEKKRGWWRR